MSELYELPCGWEWKTIGETCEILDRLRKPISQKDRISGKYPYYGATKIVDYINDYIFDEQLVLIGEDGAKWDIGDATAFIATGKYWVNNHAHVIKPKIELLDDFWLVYYLYVTDLSDYITGTTVPKLNQTKLKEIVLPLPPLPEQQRIVSKLDLLFEKIDKVIALHVKNMEEADVFMRSVLNDIFGELEEKYEKIDFDSVCNKITDGSHNPPKGIETSSYLMLSSKNIFNNSINFINPRYLKEDDFLRENKRTDVSKGDVLLTIVGTIGRAAVVNLEKKFTLQRSVAVLKPKKEILDSFFLMYSLQKNLDILIDGAKGAAQKGIYLKSIKQLEIVNVPFNIQQKTVKYLDKISQKTEKIKSIQKEKMNNLKALKASILDKAFRGEL